MKEYDVIVIGAGEGLGTVFKSEGAGLRVALVDKRKLGGTCLNFGCIPSKILIHCADVIATIREAEKLGIQTEIKKIDFEAMMERMRDNVSQGRGYIEDAIKESEKIDFYNSEAHFVEDYTLEVAGERIKGKKIFMVSGARSAIPSVKGIESIEYLTNESVLDLDKGPESLIIIGGGYIAVEYAHFFAAIGTKVIMLQHNNRLVPEEEPDISELLQKELSKRMEIHTGVETLEFKRSGNQYSVRVKDSNGKEKEFSAEKIMMAAGRRSNADLLKVENTGVKVNQKGYIEVDDYLKTSKENIWAYGDAIGRQMFTHAGDKEASIVWKNAMQNEQVKMDFSIVPHAVYSYPQIGSIGMTEEEARKNHNVLVGKAKYADVAKGKAMMEENGFAKAIVDRDSRRILGFHIIGPDASVLVQEVVNAVANNMTVASITDSMHIFPALSEIITETFNNLE